MRYIKLALISFILLFGIATLISLLLPSQIIVSRAIDINGSVDSVRSKIYSLSEWKTWLSNRDTLAITASNNTLQMGNTKVSLTSKSSTKVQTQWQVKEGQKMPCTFNIINHDNSNVVTVQWQFIQQLKWYPWEKFASIVSDEILGPFMEESLDNLKKSVEQR